MEMSETISVVFLPDVYSPTSAGSVKNSRALAKLCFVSLCGKGRLGKGIAGKNSKADAESTIQYRMDSGKLCHSGHKNVLA